MPTTKEVVQNALAAMEKGMRLRSALPKWHKEILFCVDLRVGRAARRITYVCVVQSVAADDITVQGLRSQETKRDFVETDVSTVKADQIVRKLPPKSPWSTNGV